MIPENGWHFNFLKLMLNLYIRDDVKSKEMAYREQSFEVLMRIETELTYSADLGGSSKY